MDNNSPESEATQLKESQIPEHQTRVEEIRSKLQIKKPNSPLEDLHQEARDTTAREIIRKRLREEIKTVKGKLEIAEEQALKDPLTQMFNRRFFKEYMRLQMDLLTANPAKRSFITVADIDDFGLFNKNYGTDVGDSVLRETGNTYNNTVRSTDVAARWGGEEIVASFDFDTTETGTMPLDDYLQPLNRIKDALKEVKVKDGEGKEIPEIITSSFGVTRLIPGEKFEDFFSRAATAMRFAKLLGKDRVVSIAQTDNKNTFSMTDMSNGNHYIYVKDENGGETLTNDDTGEQFIVTHNEDKKPMLTKLGE